MPALRRASPPIRVMLGLLLLWASFPSTLLAQSTPPAPAAKQDPATALDRARELIKTGDYDGAIEILRGSIDRARPDVLRDAYLLLIKTYVIVGNDYRFKPQGRENSRLNYERAKDIIAQCLGTKQLRHTQPVPASDYPEEMIGFFAEVRGKIFGSFRVADVQPADAVVLLDADTLRRTPPQNQMGDVDIAIGSHVVTVRALHYRDVTETVTIAPNSTLDRSYRLAKRRGRAWYASVGAGAAGVVAGVVTLFGGKKKPEDQPLPGAPPPPANP
jgi:hypothetical protein